MSLGVNKKGAQDRYKTRALEIEMDMRGRQESVRDSIASNRRCLEYMSSSTEKIYNEIDSSGVDIIIKNYIEEVINSIEKTLANHQKQCTFPVLVLLSP